ncbi:hypothetical protein ISG25_35230, partial [Burkholderia pseudomallei]|nr:hypothetical protein [Burkholderia pseudomallei]MBF3850749.1 hypothetical protein [Burkholderia pseudomallei]
MTARDAFATFITFQAFEADRPTPGHHTGASSLPRERASAMRAARRPESSAMAQAETADRRHRRPVPPQRRARRQARRPARNDAAPRQRRRRPPNRAGQKNERRRRPFPRHAIRIADRRSRLVAFEHVDDLPLLL